MPHTRNRHVSALIMKRIGLWPVLGILGARQTGKTTLLREILGKNVRASYVTLDSKSLREQARRAPEYFLETQGDKKSLIIDEVQKAPDLFDAIKASVDIKRIPGRFILSGSTQFSEKVGIRESLTGRMGLFHLLPMTMNETHNRELGKCWTDLKFRSHFSQKETLNYIRQGGLPGICFLRSVDERFASYESWIDTTCFRDLPQIRGRALDGELAKDLLVVVARLGQEATINNISKTLKKDTRVVKRYIEALEILFVINRLEPYALGIGKTQYYLFDSGLNQHLGGSLLQSLRICIQNEIKAQYGYAGKPNPRIKFYSSRSGSKIDLVIETREGKKFAILITDEASPSKYTMRTLTAFETKVPDCLSFIVAPSDAVTKLSKGTTLIPWTDCMS
jgi:predicted AAA+ superfamily ATPase